MPTVGAHRLLLQTSLWLPGASTSIRCTARHAWAAWGLPATPWHDARPSRPWHVWPPGDATRWATRRHHTPPNHDVREQMAAAINTLVCNRCWTMHERAMAACVSCHPALRCHSMQVLHPLPYIPMCAASSGCRRASLWPQTGLWHAATAHARPDAARRFPGRAAALQRPAWQWTHGASREWPHGLRPTRSRPQRTISRCLATAALNAYGYSIPIAVPLFPASHSQVSLRSCRCKIACTATGQRAGVGPLLRQCAAVSWSSLRLAAP